jgi:hypothetical protein
VFLLLESLIELDKHSTYYFRTGISNPAKMKYLLTKFCLGMYASSEVSCLLVDRHH